MTIGAVESGRSRSMGTGEVKQVAIVDSDTHPYLRAPEELLEYIPEPWRANWLKSVGQSAAPYWQAGDTTRKDAQQKGVPAGADPDLFDRHVLQDAGVDFVIQLPLIVGSYANPEQEVAMKSACNDWLAATWLSAYNRHGRYKGTITVSPRNPAAASAEIERWAGHPHMVGIQLTHAAPALYGDERFHPIWEAATRHHLPVLIHINSAGTPPMSSYVGFPEHYLEYHAIGFPLAYQAHMVNMICEGTFEKYPDLRVVLVEGGFGWVASMIWKLDKNFRLLRQEMRHLKRLPSEYVFDNMRFTSQPSEDLGRGNHVLNLFNLIEADKILMFSTDYPHWDFDNPARALPRMSAEATKRIMFANACELYQLPLTRAVSTI